MGFRGNQEEDGDLYIQRFYYDFKSFNSKNVDTWMNKFVKNKLPRELFTELVPKKKYQRGDVETLVGKNFIQRITQEAKHAFVKIYAPWCPHCNDVSLTFLLTLLAKTYFQPVS